MTDLHTHILPGMDDGARDLEEALTLLQLQAAQGVTQIALTSHFKSEELTVPDFLNRRQQAFEKIQRAKKQNLSGLHLKQGCEVAYTPELLQLSPELLCLEGTRILLLELPVTHRPAFLEETIRSLREQDIFPLIAHVERYGYVMDHPGILADWISWGAYIQMNIRAFIGHERRLALKMVKWRLVHVVSSDAHSLERRPPELQRGFGVISHSLGVEEAQRLEQNAHSLFHGKPITDLETHLPRQFFGMWI